MASMHSQSSSYSQEIKAPTSSSFGAKILAEDVHYLRQELQSARRTIVKHHFGLVSLVLSLPLSFCCRMFMK